MGIKMKKVVGFLSPLVAIFLVIYFFGPNLLRRLTKDLPFPTKDDQVKVEITRPDVPENITLTNRSKMTVRVYVYNDDDPVRWIAKKGWLLKPDKSVTYPLDNYRFKVVKPNATGILEPILKESGIIGSDVEITGDRRNIKISGHRKKNVTFTNNTSENIRIVAYKAEDRVHLLGLIDWYLVAGQKIEWATAPRMFNFKVFRPQLLDKPLAAASSVRDQSDIVIRSRGIWEWIKDLFS
jgi:hypothetical protein